MDKDTSGYRSGPPGGGRPEHPGMLLRRELLLPSGMGERAFARRVGVSTRTLNEILCEKRRITPRTAEKLARAYPQVPAETWNQRQQAYDAWKRAQARLLQPSTVAKAGGATTPS